MNNEAVAIVGAGPAGIAAAREVCAAGRDCILIDEQGRAGGQIWRGGEADDALSRAWLAGLAVPVLHGAVVDADPASRRLTVETAEGSRSVRFDQLILATGARELFLPFPGWTRPGAFGAGGLQALVKNGYPVRGKTVVVAGSGPLLLAVAGALRRHGARVAAVVEQTSRARLLRFAASLAGHPEKLLAAWRLRRGVSYRTSRWVASFEPGRVLLNDGKSIACDLLACGYGLAPNVELARLLGCAIENGFVAVGEGQRAGDGIFAAGEITGIGGVEKSLAEGQAAGRAACGLSAASLRHSLASGCEFARNLSRTFALRPELKRLARQETVVCRCEDVTFGELSACGSWREAKLQTRCGMGPCQGRICGPANSFLFGWPAPAVRPPLLPARISSLIQNTKVES